MSPKPGPLLVLSGRRISESCEKVPSIVFVKYKRAVRVQMQFDFNQHDGEYKDPCGFNGSAYVMNMSDSKFN